MPVKIRLSRQGKKGYPYYHIVVADSRAPRDGRYIERLGSYNPNTNPATIEFDFDRALDWLQKGALPTDTTRSILSKKGVMVKKHLLEGAKKGAFTAEVAEEKFEAWLKERETKDLAQKDQITKAKDADRNSRLKAETKVREARAQAIAKRLATESTPAPLAVEAVAEAPVKVVAEVVAEKPAEVVAEVVTEAPAAEENNEAPAAE